MSAGKWIYSSQIHSAFVAPSVPDRHWLDLIELGDAAAYAIEQQNPLSWEGRVR